VRFRSRVYIIILLGAITACITTPDEVVIAPIHQALTAGNASEVQKAAANKNQLSALNEYGETPLLYAVKYRKTDLVDILLSKGADPNAQNPTNGETPLIVAVKKNNDFMVKKLLKAGAQSDVLDNEGTSPLKWAIRKNHVTIVKTILADIGANNTELPSSVLEASAFGRTEVLSYLLSIGTPVNARSARGETPLILAARFGHIKTIRKLISIGVDLNTLDVDGASGLTWAARLDQADVVDALSKAGAAVNPVDSAGFTPLAHAVRLGHAEVVNVLIARQASVNLVLPKGLSMMYWAAFQEHIAEQLYISNAEIRKIENNEVEPLVAAVRYLWLARFYEGKLLNKAGNQVQDKDNVKKCYEWSALFFDKASEQYDGIAKDIKSAERWAKITAFFLAAAAETASQVQAEMQARQMAEISALGQASSRGTGLPGYYSALAANRRVYTPTATIPQLTAYSTGSQGTGLSGYYSALGSNRSVYTPTTTYPQLTADSKGSSPMATGDSSPFFEMEANKCSQSAMACREIIKCYDTGDPRSPAIAECTKTAVEGIRYLK